MASLLCGVLCTQAALADINGGGSTLPQALYQTSGVLTAGFTPYIGMDLGRDKAAFLRNDYSLWVPGSTGKSVHWAASESKLSTSELSGYLNAHYFDWGPLIQVPSAATTVAIPFNKPGSAAVDLSVNELCGVFSGRVNRWEQISGAERSGPITLVYPAGSHGTTELLTRFLNARCQETYPFMVTTSLANAYPYGPPMGAVAANSSMQIMQEINARTGSIGYVGPTYAAATPAGLDDATRVARVGKDVANNISGISPAPANIADAISSLMLPALADRGNPDKWIPVFGRAGVPGVVPYPESGYPILGFTHLIFSQCYADATQTTQVRDFFTRHFAHLASKNNDEVIKAKGLVPLPHSWKAVVRSTFLSASNPLSIGNPNACNGIGRPQ
jgi:ABC-type phosphate transport system substrate-binding protein